MGTTMKLATIAIALTAAFAAPSYACGPGTDCYVPPVIEPPTTYPEPTPPGYVKDPPVITPKPREPFRQQSHDSTNVAAYDRQFWTGICERQSDGRIITHTAFGLEPFATRQRLAHAQCRDLVIRHEAGDGHDESNTGKSK